MRHALTVIAVLAVLCIFAMFILTRKAKAEEFECEGALHTDVTITAFFTPREHDYTGPKISVSTDDGPRSYKQAFLEKGLYAEWNGISESDGALGYWDEDNDGKNEIHHVPYPLDASGEKLVAHHASFPDIEGTAGASDFLEHGTLFRVLTLPGKPLYRVRDDMDAPTSEHQVNLYAGEGLSGEKLSRELTQLGGKGIICVLDEEE